MTILTRYILREITKIFVIILLAFVMIYVVVDFFERIDNFIEAGAQLRYMLIYIFFKLPLVVDQMTPVAMLMATIIGLGLLARGNEIIALKASGVSPFRLIVPLLFLATLISLISFINSESIVPYTNRRVNAIWKTRVDKESPEFIYKYESIWYKGVDAIYNIRTCDVAAKTLLGVVINQFGQDFRTTQRIHAQRAVWKDGRWHFLNGTIKQRQRDGTFTISTFSEMIFPLHETPEDFEKGIKPSDEMGFGELRRYAEKIEREGYSARTYWVDMHVKLAFPCISLIMGLMGIALAFRKEKGRGVAAGIGFGFAIIALYLVTFELFRTLGYTGIVPPFLAAWASNILFATVGTCLILFTNR
jgi:lipopolysaccharide export system permease protein